MQSSPRPATLFLKFPATILTISPMSSDREIISDGSQDRNTEYLNLLRRDKHANEAQHDGRHRIYQEHLNHFRKNQYQQHPFCFYHTPKLLDELKPIHNLHTEIA